MGNTNSRRVFKLVVVCVLADVLNVMTSYFFYDLLHIPLFMDTIFTVAITFYYGLIPGVVVGLLYNALTVFVRILRGISPEPVNMLFGICGALIALITWIFARRKAEFKISLPITCLYLVLIAMLTSFVTIFTSGIIDFIRYTYFQSPAIVAPIREFTASFVHQKFSLLASCILGQIPISFTDRLITTFLGYGVFRLMVKAFGEERWR
ncbi:MAG: hypothetical protein IJ558_05010 [Treponema sp.]|nr:hypothetical protein [Treponema sp.]